MKTIRNFSDFNKINENKEPKRFPKENKFKRVIDNNEEILQSLIEHKFTGEEDNEGGFIIFDIIEKNYNITNEKPLDIRECVKQEFDHIMDNL